MVADVHPTQLPHDPHPPLGGTADRAPRPLAAAGRVLGRVISLAVIAAAGVAGWMIVDEVAFAPVAGAVDTTQSTSPWPAAFRQPATNWDSFTLTYRRDGAPTHRSSTDAATGRTRITYFDESGAPASFAEVSGRQVWVRAVGDDQWTRMVDGAERVHLQLGLAAVEPSHLSSIVPSWVEPFVAVAEQPSEGEHTQLVVAIDAAAAQASDPVAFARWRQEMYFDSAGGGAWTWTVDVRDDGYVVRWAGRYPWIEAWSENPTDLVFESPLQPRPTAPATPLPTSPADDAVGG